MYSVYLSGSMQEKNIGIDGMSEEMRMQSIVDDIAPSLRKKGITVYRNNPAWSLGELIEDSNSKKPNLHIAFHSNAGGGTGVETWTYKIVGTPSATFGLKLQAAVVNAIGLKDRGIKDATVKGSIKSEVTRTEATAVLIELFFHDNATDVYTFNAKRQAVIDAIVKTILDWFKADTSDLPWEYRMVKNAVQYGWTKEEKYPMSNPTWAEVIQVLERVTGKA